MDMPNIKKNHIGRKIERIRELRGMKQETLAVGLGISQQAVSKMEQSEEIDEARIAQVAEILGVTVDAIKNFNEDTAIYNVQNNYDNATNNVNFQSNPLEKIVEIYERLLDSERKRNELLEQLLKKK